MKKVLYLVLTIGLLISCHNGKTISEIDDFIIEVDNRTDLSESITEFITENLDGEIDGGISIYDLTDTLDNIHRIRAEVSSKRQSPAYYEFYFKNGSLSYAEILEFDTNGSDTIIYSKYYYSGEDLLKQIDLKDSTKAAETVRQASEFYYSYGKETNN